MTMQDTNAQATCLGMIKSKQQSNQRMENENFFHWVLRHVCKKTDFVMLCDDTAIFQKAIL